ncbi:MAG: hypothetical protein D6714_19245 [Bacteroidetes bacterium]|nr:MAG: hypothetical protein D6714_19245 [Bacteroidota bacterium]
MKKRQWIWTLIFGLWTTGLLSQKVYTVETVPDPKAAGGGWVADPDKYIPDADEARLNALISALEDSTTVQIAVVVLGSIGEENPKEFAVKLFEKWKIGQADKDNGLLILSVMDQRRTEFETGYGLEGVLPDVVCYRIGMQELVPYFKLGEYGKGLIAAVQKIKTILENPEAASEVKSFYDGGARSPIPGVPVPLFWYGLVNLIFHLIIAVWVLLTLWNKEDLYDKYQSVRKVYGWWWGIPFPIPYFIVMWGLKRLLTRLRNAPRYSKETGQLLRKLSEEEEDRFLESGQIVEEEIGSVDYDVWVSEDESELLILRYAPRFSKYRRCPQCGFITYFLARTETIERATRYSTGRRRKEYQCKNCGYTHEVFETIPRIQSSRGGGGFSGGGGGSSWGGGSSGGGGAGVSW